MEVVPFTSLTKLTFPPKKEINLEFYRKTDYYVPRKSLRLQHLYTLRK